MNWEGDTMSRQQRTAPSRSIRRNLLALTMMIAAGSGTTVAEPLPTAADDDFPNLPALAAEELRTLRGGFEFAGLKFDFAAQLRTYVDGRLALETLISYTGSGAVTQHRPMPQPDIPAQPVPSSTSSPSSAPPAPPTQTAAPNAGGSVQLLGPDQDRTPAQVNLPGIDLSGLKNAAGILINDRKGAILALHEATRERITSMVVNQATGRDIRQELNVDVTVRNFQQFRDTMRDTLLNNRLSATQR